MGEKKGIWTQLLDIDRRVISVILIILITIPLVRPFGFPIPISEMSIDFYNTVESLPEGALVGVSHDVGVATWSEIGGQAVAFIKQCMDKKLKVVIWASGTDGILLAVENLTPIFEEGGYKYGEDFVTLSFIPGFESGIVALAQDFQGTVKKDYYGNLISDLPITKGIKGATDFDLVVLFEGGRQTTSYVMHWSIPFEIKLLSGVTSAVTALFVTYLKTPVGDSYALQGMLSGLRGSGEYEVLTGFLGPNIAKNDMISITLLFCLFLIILANIGVLMKKQEL